MNVLASRRFLIKSKPVKRKPASRKKATPPMAMPDDYQAQSDLATLKRAAEIKADRKRIAAAERELKKEKAALEQIEGKMKGTK